MPLTEDQLKKLTTELTNMGYNVQGETRFLVSDLVEDLTVGYQANYSRMTENVYHEAWTYQIMQRLKPIMTAVKATGLKDNAAEVKEIVALVRPLGKGTEIDTINFGQRRIAFNFAPSANKHNQDVAGKHIYDYAQDLHLGTVAVRERPCSVFFHSDQWVTSNNRGFAALSLAGKKPTRIRPVPPTSDETNRLSEVTTGLKYGNALNKDVQPGINLPSPSISVTAGPNQPQVLYTIQTATAPSYSMQNETVRSAAKKDYIDTLQDCGVDTTSYAPPAAKVPPAAQ